MLLLPENEANIFSVQNGINGGSILDGIPGFDVTKMLTRLDAHRRRGSLGIWDPLVFWDSVLLNIISP